MLHHYQVRSIVLKEFMHCVLLSASVAIARDRTAVGHQGLYSLRCVFHSRDLLAAHVGARTPQSLPTPLPILSPLPPLETIDSLSLLIGLMLLSIYLPTFFFF